MRKRRTRHFFYSRKNVQVKSIMLMKLFFLSLLVISCQAVSIPLIRDVIFVPISQSNSTIITNRTCLECLCMNSSSQLLLNCFPNSTCQYFSDFPRRYKLEPTNNATLYFPQAIFPNASQCCMPNLTDVLNRLKIATPIYGGIAAPRCLAIDNHGYLVTVSETATVIVRFNATNLAMIDNITSLSPSASTINYYNGNYYLGLTNFMRVVNSTSLTVQNDITSSNISGTRDMIFLNNGQTLVLASTGNGRLLFFNRVNNISTNYNLTYVQLVSYAYPHGLHRVNDTFFYATSWSGNTVWSYSALANTTQWSEGLFINATPTAPASNGNHLLLDECGRWWFSLGINGLQIFDKAGVFLANLTFPGVSVFDTVLTENYLLYLSDLSGNRIIHIDPNIQC